MQVKVVLPTGEARLAAWDFTNMAIVMSTHWQTNSLLLNMAIYG
jgi:hypothetical protein